MNNTSGIFPAGRAVLVEHYEPEREDSLIQLPDAVKASQAMLNQRAVVVAVGPCAWHDEPQPRARVGEKVIISKFAGYMATGTLDGKSYRLVNDRDIFAIITDNHVVE